MRFPSFRFLPVLSAALALFCAPFTGLAQDNLGVIRNAAILKFNESLIGLDLDAAGGRLEMELAPKFVYPSASGEYVKINTPFGDIYLEFFTADAPLTVANFKSYLATDSSTESEKLKTYDGTFIHRSVTGFVIQGGGFRPIQGLPEIEKKDPVANEFYVANIRGTVAMAKVGPATGQAPNEETINSATNQWFINLADNSANLDNQNGGFTAFARVLGDGMKIVDRIAALNRANLGAPFDSMPYYNVTSGQTDLTFSNLFPLNTVRLVPASSVPAALKASPTFSFSIIANDRPSAVKASVKNGNLILTSGKNGGTANITLRVSTPEGVTNDFIVQANKIGRPTIVKQLPAVSSAALNTTASLFADFTSWPLNIRWQIKANASADWTDLVAGSTFGGVNTETLTISLPGATTEQAAASLALQGAQFRYIINNTIKGVARSVESRPTSLRITTALAFASPLAATTTAALGSTVTLSGAATASTQPAPTYQWQRLAPGSSTWQNLTNSTESAPTPYSGATSATFRIALTGTGNAALAARDLDKSRFRCVITHDLGAGPVTAEGKPTTLRVTTLKVGISAQPAPVFTGQLGGAASLSVTSLPAASNTPIVYKWQRKAAGASTFVDLVNSTEAAPTAYSGVTTRTLTIALPDTDPAAAAASLARTDDQYQCVISNVLGSATSKPSTLLVLAANFNYVTAENKTLSGLTAQNDRTFAITGLPKGLALNSSTGAITGTATAKAGIYKVVVSVRDGGSVTETRTYFIEVKALSGNNAGGYEALLETETAPPYAKLTLLISSGGAYSGTLTTAEDGKILPLKGAVVRSAADGSVSLASPLVIPRPGSPSGRLLELDFSITSTGILTAELGSRANADAPLVAGPAATTANPGVRLASYSSGNAAPAYGSSPAYTLAFTSPAPLDEDDDDAFPEGSGYALGQIAIDGTLTLRGKLADGTPITAKLATDTAADYRLFILPYGSTPNAWFSAKLPLTGSTTFRPGSSSDLYTRYSLAVADREETYWRKPAAAKSAGYLDGFGPLGLVARMEPWNPTDYAQLGVVITSDALKRRTTLLLSGDALSNEAPNASGLPSDIALTPSNARLAKFTTPDANAFTGRFVPLTGFFSGNLKLNTPTPTRTVKFEGVFLMGPGNPEAEEITAEGFTLVPAARGATPSTPASGRIQFAQPAD